jgi:hypothetical protein
LSTLIVDGAAAVGRPEPECFATTILPVSHLPAVASEPVAVLALPVRSSRVFVVRQSVY